MKIFTFTNAIESVFASEYSEKCTKYLFGVNSMPIFRLLWVIAKLMLGPVELKLNPTASSRQVISKLWICVLIRPISKAALLVL
tara:strand:- start:2062 stop:2313 length:252 start_codon:yes stop_codon:yes gene_type:complete